ncbi:thiamine pyrophosphate-dependent dehydrogenase E1 component subunit alpha [Persicirhabdus sediminis]|nr:thiamine pyrophosphate-dependent dehydrogenase E1 component subunit alpha [Persicirhabdus sediminis]
MIPLVPVTREDRIDRNDLSGVREDLPRIYLAMLRARVLEDKLSSLYKAGKIVGGVYLGRGHEAVSGSLASYLHRGIDIFAPLIRDQAGRTAFGESLMDVTRTYLGSVEGPMKGRDGNIHRGRPQEGMPAMISHLGSSVALVAGMLMARRMQGRLEGVVGATSLGDGATSTGAFHEGLNTAAVEKLPMVVLVVNNQFAYSTGNDRQFACADLVDRARGYGVAGHKVQGNDLIAVAETMKKAVSAARDGGGPQLVVADLLRLCGHGEHDDASYVPAEMRASGLARDCMQVAEGQLIDAGVFSRSQLDEMRAQAVAEVQSAVAQTQQESAPHPHHDDWRTMYHGELEE